MSVGNDTLRLGRELRKAVNAAIDDETRALVKAWDRAWRGIVREWEAAVDDALAADGPLTIGQVRRLTRARNAVTAATDRIGRILADQRKRLTAVADEIARETVGLNARLIAGQMPRTEGTKAELTARFDRVDADALDAIVRRTTRQVTSLSRPLSKRATEEMLRVLTHAIPGGLSPRTAAARLVRQLEGKFNGGLARALTITRTELLDAYRTAAGAQQAANADVLQGWVWVAELDRRTCPACVAQHGSEHSLEEPGPMDHQNGRCARTPLVKPWKRLGFSAKEPPSTLVAGPDWFADQPEGTQLAILGPDRLAALQGGRAGWDDMVQRRRTAGWRDSYGSAPISDVA